MPVDPADPTEIRGMLLFDAVEAGCAYVRTDAGRRYEIVYPDGWRIDAGQARILGPGGRSVSAGQRVTLHGAVTDTIVTFCQLGPVFEATSIASP